MGLYTRTKFGGNALSESLGQEQLANRVRVSGTGTVDTELASHARDELEEGIAQTTRSIELLRPSDIPRPSPKSSRATGASPSMRS